MAGASPIVSAKKRALFVQALAQCGNVRQAADIAGMSWRHAHRLRAERSDFAAEWDEALQQAADRLELEAWRRAHDGIEKPLTCAKGLIFDEMGQPLMVREYSDTLLIFLLKGARPEKYRDNVHVTAKATNIGVTLVMERLQNDPQFAERANSLARLLTGVVDDSSGAE